MYWCPLYSRKRPDWYCWSVKFCKFRQTSFYCTEIPLFTGEIFEYSLKFDCRVSHMSTSVWSPIQNSGLVLKNCPNRNAVSGVMALFPRITSLTRTLVIPIASANCFWLMPRGIKNSCFKISPGVVGRLFLGSIFHLINDIAPIQDRLFYLHWIWNIISRDHWQIWPIAPSCRRAAGEGDLKAANLYPAIPLHDSAYPSSGVVELSDRKEHVCVFLCARILPAMSVKRIVSWINDNMQRAPLQLKELCINDEASVDAYHNFRFPCLSIKMSKVSCSWYSTIKRLRSRISENRVFSVLIPI